MRFLFTTIPGLGHLHPMLPIAQALVHAGHDVAFACAKSFCRHITAQGIPCFPAGLDWLESYADEAFPEIAAIPLEQRPSHWLVTEVFADAAAYDMVPDLLRICTDWQPDVLVRNDFEFGACIVAERLGIPNAVVGMETYLPSYVWDPLISEPLAYIRSVYGLNPYPPLEMIMPDLYLACSPSSYHLPDFPLPSVAQMVRPAFFDQNDGETLPDWVADLPAQPTLYVTLGTVYNQAPDVFEMVVSALRDEPINVIMTLGSGPLPESDSLKAPNIHIERYIPQTLLLPHCDAAIIHGGFQTTLSVLGHGLPLVTVPISATDPLRAIRCMDLGVGIVLRYGENTSNEANPLWQFAAPENTKQHQPFTEETIHNSVRSVLHDQRFRSNAEAFRQTLQDLHGMESAVARLTSLTKHKQSVVA